MPPITLNQLIAIVVGLLLCTLSGTTWYYHHELNALHDSDLLLKHDNEVAQQQATAKLKQLTAERDAKQAALDQQAKEQGEKDAQAQSDISALHDKLLHTPVRVQYLPSTADHRSTTGQASTSTANSAADQSASSGVLPESNTQRLASAIAEIETLSAAYGSCRATLIEP